MPCYHPVMAWRGLKKTGDVVVSFGRDPRFDFIAAGRISIPCGQCIGCRLERSRQWAVRCVYEASLYPENSFITLTYKEHLRPAGNSLLPRDLQLFIKRLRKSFDFKIRFFACGEYGDRTGHPHYHIIAFNYYPEDLESVDVVTEEGLSRVVRRSPKLESIWGFGHVVVGNVSFESCAYVARYCLKKVTGPGAAAHYKGREPEFIRMSRRPGIASEWFDKFKDGVVATDTVLARGHPCKPPRFFDKCLERIDASLLSMVKLRRAEGAEPVDLDVLSRREDFVLRSVESSTRGL